MRSIMEIKLVNNIQGRIQDLIRGGGPDRDRPKTAILGPQFCRILVLGPHFWWSGGGGPGPRGPPLDPPLIYLRSLKITETFSNKISRKCTQDRAFQMDYKLSRRPISCITPSVTIFPIEFGAQMQTHMNSAAKHYANL